MSNGSIWFIDRTWSGLATLGQSGTESDSNDGVLRVSQSSSITEASLSESFVSYPETRCGWVLLLHRDAVGVFNSPSWQGKCVYVRVGNLILWHINTCGLFNDKLYIYIYIYIHLVSE